MTKLLRCTQWPGVEALHSVIYEIVNQLVNPKSNTPTSISYQLVHESDESCFKHTIDPSSLFTRELVFKFLQSNSNPLCLTICHLIETDVYYADMVSLWIVKQNNMTFNHALMLMQAFSKCKKIVNQ